MHRLAPPCAALALFLGGCAADADAWTKPGAAKDKIAADLDACRSEAQAAVRRDAGIDADIMATRSQDWQRTGTLGLKRDEMTEHRAGSARTIIARCMAAKGYKPAG